MLPLIIKNSYSKVMFEDVFVCLFNFIKESINCSLTSRMVSSLTYVSLGQSIVLDSEKAFVIVCQIILN